MRKNSSILFDLILVYGARAANGLLSRQYQMLHGLLRQHTSDLILRLSQAATTSIDDIRALLVIASYSNSGAVLLDIAIQAANSIGLSRDLECLLASTLGGDHIRQEDLSSRRSQDTHDLGDQDAFRAARVYYYLFVGLQPQYYQTMFSV